MVSKNSNKQNLKAILTGLPEDVSIDRVVEHPHSLELCISWGEPSVGKRFCNNCGSNHCVKKDSGTYQTIRHLPIGQKGSFITFHKPRYCCKDCGKSFYAKPKWVISDICVSYPLLLEITSYLLSSTHSVTDIARRTFTTPAIIQNIISHFDMSKPHSLPITLSIDEFKGNTGCYNKDIHRYDTEKYHCVITNPDKGIVLDILYKATFPSLYDYFQSYSPSQRYLVKYFCTDMRPGFIKVARKCFPNAKICIDPFHVIKLLTDSLSKIRTDEWRRLLFNQKLSASSHHISL